MAYFGLSRIYPLIANICDLIATFSPYHSLFSSHIGLLAVPLTLELSYLSRLPGPLPHLQCCMQMLPYG